MSTQHTLLCVHCCAYTEEICAMPGLSPRPSAGCLHGFYSDGNMSGAYMQLSTITSKQSIQHEMDRVNFFLDASII